MEKHSTEYNRYLKSDAWKEKRQQRLEIDDFKCCMCGRPDGVRKDGTPVLQVHHIHYRTLGNEGMEDLCSFCPRCHKLIHSYYGRFRTLADKQAAEQVSCKGDTEKKTHQNF